MKMTEPRRHNGSEPRIVGFLCSWSCGSGNAAPSTGEPPCPDNAKIIRVMCSGRVTPAFILKALACGADGVLIASCHPGDCHYVSGNYQTTRRIESTRKLLEQLGVEPERLRMQAVPGGDGAALARAVSDFTETLKGLGPSPLERRC
jgi:F420-non-reducing hydrogenase iron-sulfur subunit